jgi:streptogramin lyase
MVQRCRSAYRVWRRARPGQVGRFSSGVLFTRTLFSFGAADIGTVLMRMRIVAVVVYVVAAAACAAQPPSASAGPAVARDIDPGGAPTGLAFDFGSLWVGLGDKGTVARIDPLSGEVIKDVTVGDAAKLLPQSRIVHGVPSAVVSGFGSIWAVGADGMLARVDPATNEVTRFALGVVGGAIAAGDGALWITSYDDGALVRFDPASQAVSRTVTDLGGLFGVALGFGSVWVVSKTGHQVLRLDPTSGVVTARIPAERNPDWVTVGAGSVWVTRESPRAVLRIDPSTNAVVATIPGEPSWGIGTAIAFYDGAVWTGFLVRIDPATEKVSASFTGPGEARSLTFGAGFAWASDVVRVHQIPFALVR